MNNGFDFLIYKAADEEVSVNAVIKDDTIWLTQKSMAELFDVNIPAISKHLTNIYEDGELVQSSTISKMEIVQTEGSRQVKRNLEFYNLDAIISVGYRVNSKRPSQKLCKPPIWCKIEAPYWRFNYEQQKKTQS